MNLFQERITNFRFEIQKSAFRIYMYQIIKCIKPEQISK